jgi:hypothetical protein
VRPRAIEPEFRRLNRFDAALWVFVLGTEHSPC